MDTIKEIEEIKQKYNLDDVDIWCIKYQLYNDDYSYIPDDIINKITNSKELSIVLNEL